MLTIDAQVTLDDLEGVVIRTVEIEFGMRERGERRDGEEEEEEGEMEECSNGVELHWRRIWREKPAGERLCCWLALNFQLC